MWSKRKVLLLFAIAIALCLSSGIIKMPLSKNNASNLTTTVANLTTTVANLTTPDPLSKLNLSSTPNVDNQTHLVLVSATLYRESKIYAPNTVVLLFVAPDQPSTVATRLQAKSLNATHSRLDSFAVKPAHQRQLECKWTTFFAVIKSVRQPTNVELSANYNESTDGSVADIPLRPAFSDKSGQVGICYSPLFFFEQWQLFIISVEISKHYGVDLQIVYVQSALSHMFDMVQTYSNTIEIEPWPSIGLSAEDVDLIGLDPNMELNWRNQATAHTDCLIKYREAFDFLIVSDLDDVFSPTMRSNYAAEFNFLAQMHPKAAGFMYRRNDLALTAGKNGSHFHFNETFLTMDLYGNEGDRVFYKSVVNTSRVETFWIHWPGNALDGFSLVNVDQSELLHLRKWRYVNGSVERRQQPENDFRLVKRNMVNTRIVQKINANFQRRRQLHKDVFAALAGEKVYAAKIDACYKMISLDIVHKLFDKCPAPNICNIGDMAGLQCVVARRRFSSRALSAHLHIYTAQKEATFERRKNGCTF